VDNPGQAHAVGQDFGMDHRRLIRIIRRQKGIFNQRQAIECGYSAYQVRKRLEAGQWQRVVGSSYARSPVCGSHHRFGTAPPR
jgi:hypothetical protein